MIATEEVEEAAVAWIMIAGPYTTGARTDIEREENLAAMNRAAYAVLVKGHVPIIGVNLALPIIRTAADDGRGDVFDDVMMPVSLAAAERCDGVLRVGGPSAGADDEVARIAARGGSVYRRVEDVPQAS